MQLKIEKRQNLLSYKDNNKKCYSKNSQTPIDKNQEEKSDDVVSNKSNKKLSELDSTDNSLLMAESSHDTDQIHSTVYLSSSFKLILMFIFVTILSTIKCVFLSKMEVKEISESKTLDNFTLFHSRVIEIKKDYIRQDANLWLKLLTSTKRILKTTQPRYPATLIFAVPHSALKTSDSLSQKLVQAFNSILNIDGVRILDCSQLNNTDADQQKLELDNQLEEIFKSDHRAVLIDRLEVLFPISTVLFHGYCDDDVAPFKNVLFLFKVHLPHDFLVESENDIKSYLQDIWKDLGKSELDALFSRMASNIATVMPE